ncbi:L-seryl-tRNA(Sec) selenium transferase, partial [Nitrospinae bacterium AH_259_B05_G02_I21]|nr:L-seryl-tRNA(Sec) selenium transferase [Nitrospinae bacterium AH_259_B05_G02_I21]
LMTVHPSNYRVVGFTEEAELADLVELGRARGIPVIEDLGSGCLVDLRGLGIEDEPTVADRLATGVDLVTFSGDKLLGGPQAG